MRSVSRSLSPRFSLVVPTFRRPHLVGRAIASALGQTFGEFEVVVVDDGGDDETHRAVEAAAGGDPRVRYVARAKPGGVSRARNEGIARAEAPWVVFLDDDDELRPSMLATVAARIAGAEPPLGFLWCAIAMVRDTPDGEVPLKQRIWGPHFDRPAGSAPLTAPLRRRTEADAVRIGAGFGLTVRRDLLERVGAFDPALVIAEETDLVLRLMAAGASFDAVRSVQVTVHRVSGQSLSNTTTAARRVASVERLVEKNREMLIERPHLEAKMWESLGLEHARAGDSRRAWRMAGRLLRRHPTTRNAWRQLWYAIASHTVRR